RAGRPLYDEHSVGEVRAYDFRLRIRQPVRRLRSRGCSRDLLRVAQTLGTHGARSSSLFRVAQPKVELVVLRVAAGFEELVSVEIVGHLVRRVERVGFGREQLMPVAERRVLEVHRKQAQRDARSAYLFDDGETTAHESPRR